MTLNFKLLGFGPFTTSSLISITGIVASYFIICLSYFKDITGESSFEYSEIIWIGGVFLFIGTCMCLKHQGYLQIINDSDLWESMELNSNECDVKETTTINTASLQASPARKFANPFGLNQENSLRISTAQVSPMVPLKLGRKSSICNEEKSYSRKYAPSDPRSRLLSSAGSMPEISGSGFAGMKSKFGLSDEISFSSSTGISANLSMQKIDASLD